MNCPKCNGSRLQKNGTTDPPGNKQKYKCAECGFRFTLGSQAETKQKQVFIKSKHKMVGLSIDDFRKKNDVVYILSLVPPKFEDEMIYEKSDIINLAKLSPGFPGINTVLESEEWKQYSGRAGSKTWYAKSELITKLKSEGIMR